LVADFERGIVSIDPRDGSSRRLLAPKVIPNLIQITGEGDAWVVDDSRRRVIPFDPDGDRAADAARDSPIAAMALDAIGNLWLAEGSAVVRLNEAAEVTTEIGGFTNASRLHICGAWLVVSDSDTGDIAWIDPRSAALSRRDSTRDGVVVACDEGGAWLSTADGSIALLPPP
jgi:sugar lactone lactonase YvrE